MTNYRLSLEEKELLRSVGVHRVLGLTNNGRKLFINCPLHNERTPSFVVFPDGGYKCFGCGKSGRGALDLYMHLGLDFKASVDEVLKIL